MMPLSIVKRHLRALSRKHRHAGDQARDQKNWRAASEAYRRFLEHHPADFDIWVQYGHSLKEQDNLAAAEQAYRTGLGLRPDDVDAQVHLAHLLKRVGDIAGAAVLFTGVFRHVRRRSSFQELTAVLGSDDVPVDSAMRAACSVTGPAVFFEIDDLLTFLVNHQTVSGIQRVQIGIIEGIIRDHSASATSYLFVVSDVSSSFLWSAQTDDLLKIIVYLQQPVVDHGILRKMVADLWSNTTATVVRQGQVYFNIGSFWDNGRTIERYAALKRHGVLLGAYIHDIIPVSHPEFCEAELVRNFTLSLGDGLSLFDFMLVATSFTRQEIERYQLRQCLPTIPVGVVPLAHARAHVDGVEANWGGSIAFLRGRRYVLMVSTIEGRKNHALLVTAWKEFLSGGENPPDLVFVGRRGWRMTTFFEMLAATRNLNGHVHLLHDLSDNDLAILYENCLFTVFPSFVEGWGLPVSESLAHGKPCVASNTSSVPEVGGDLIDYLDPLNIRGSIDVLRRMMSDDDYRRDRASTIRRTFKSRTWADVTTDILSAIDDMHQRVVPSKYSGVVLASGEIFWANRLAAGDVPTDYAAHPYRLMLMDGWSTHHPFSFGVSGQPRQLSFRSDLPIGTDIEAYIQIQATESTEHMSRLSIWIGQDHSDDGITPAASWTGQVWPGFQSCIHLVGVVGPDQIVGIRLQITGPSPRKPHLPGGGQCVLAIGAIGYAPHADIQARLRLAEALLQGPSTVPNRVTL